LHCDYEYFKITDEVNFINQLIYLE
jgi:hypothetical protein